MSDEIDMSDAADARRFRWLLNGNGYFFEEEAMTGNQHGDWRRMRQAVDDAMKAEEAIRCK